MIPIHVIIWQIMAEKGKAADAKAEAQVLQHQIAHSPKKLEMALKRVEEAIQAETEAKKEEANSAEVFRHKLLMSRDVLEVIKRRNETIQPALSTVCVRDVALLFLCFLLEGRAFRVKTCHSASMFVFKTRPKSRKALFVLHRLTVVAS
ncbi:unnamed protein product [Closterium sp. NIES-53]